MIYLFWHVLYMDLLASCDVFGGFCLQRVRKVIGIELCQEAVEDAKVNAKLNGKTADKPPVICSVVYLL